MARELPTLPAGYRAVASMLFYVRPDAIAIAGLAAGKHVCPVVVIDNGVLGFNQTCWVLSLTAADVVNLYIASFLSQDELDVFAAHDNSFKRVFEKRRPPQGEIRVGQRGRLCHVSFLGDKGKFPPGRFETDRAIVTLLTVESKQKKPPGGKAGG